MIGYWDGALWIFGVGLVMVPLTIIAALIAGWSKGTRGPVGWFRILVVAFVLAFVLWLVTAATVETLPIQI